VKKLNLNKKKACHGPLLVEKCNFLQRMGLKKVKKKKEQIL
jgi:hypothetical protein